MRIGRPVALLARTAARSPVSVRAVDALFDLLDEEIGEARNRVRRHGHARILRRKESLPGAGDHVQSGFPRNLLKKPYVAPHVIGREVDNGVDPCRAYKFKFLD